MKEIEPDLIGPARAATFLDIKRRTLDDWIYKQRKQYTPDPLPVRKSGRLNKFHPIELQEWRDRRKQTPTV